MEQRTSDNSVTVQDGLIHYRHQVSILKKGYGQEKYRIDQISKSFLGPLLVGEVTSVDIAKYRDIRLQTVNQKTGRTLSASTVRLELALLSNFFDVSRIEWGWCDKNPVANVRKPKCPPGRDRRLTSREERLILRYCHAHVNPDLYSIVVLALETAMRQGEILKLRWEHVNVSRRIAHLPETKNGTKRDVPLSLRAREALTRLGIKSQGPVFTYTSQGLKSSWRFMLIKLGISDLHFHDLRHEAVSRLFELGTMDMMEVAAISGHKSLSMLKRYTHLKAQRLVRKLEGHRNKGRQVVMDHLVPYPAEITHKGDTVSISLLDFDNVSVSSQCKNKAFNDAQNVLLKTILNYIKEAKPVPAPDQYLRIVPECNLVTIDPLGDLWH